MHRFVRISGNTCFAIFHSAMAEKHLFTKRMKNETTAIICIAAKRLRRLSRGNIAFYMFLPAKIDHAPVSTWWSGSHNNGARARALRSLRARETGYAKQMKRSRSDASRKFDMKSELYRREQRALYKSLFGGRRPSFRTLNLFIGEHTE